MGGSDLERTFTPVEVTQVYKLSLSFLAQDRMKKKNVLIPFVRLGRKILYRREDVETYLTKNRVGASEGDAV